jgi:hypothetical protein
MNNENLFPGDAYTWNGYSFIIILGFFPAISGYSGKPCAVYTVGKGITIGPFSSPDEVAKRRIWKTE